MKAETMLLNRKVRTTSRLTNNVEWYSHHIEKNFCKYGYAKLILSNMYKGYANYSKIVSEKQIN